MVEHLLAQPDANKGYNAQTGQYVDMISSGIIDPVLVVRHALADAACVSNVFKKGHKRAQSKHLQATEFASALASGENIYLSGRLPFQECLPFFITSGTEHLFQP